MKVYDFDRLVPRRNTGCVKYDSLKEVFGREDLTPMWVADMDFETPDFILDAIRSRLEHPVFGYPSRSGEYFDAVVRWVSRLHGWNIREEWITYIPGIVKGIGHVLQVFTAPGDKVVIQTPVYHPFRLLPQRNGRQLVFNPLIYDTVSGRYSMDFDRLESQLDSKCKVLILSNPHNPAGVMWTRQELERLAHICASRGIVVISDEIHAEMAYGNRCHIPFASVSDEAERCSITFMAPSKTFNIAGIVSSYAVVPDERLRSVFFAYLKANEFDAPSIFSSVATVAAYSEQGFEWRRQMLEYVWGNILYAESRVAEISGLEMHRPDASFLIWIDCRGLMERLLDRSGLSDAAPQRRQVVLDDFFISRAHLALNSGMMFSSDGGSEGMGFMRMNVGAPLSVVTEAFDNICKAVGEL